jgi:hypothetical protein
VLLGGCQLLFDVDVDVGCPDLDGDQICDQDDTCIQPESDALADIDGDGDGDDACPLDMGSGGPNGDGDEIEDLCDPHPAESVPDRRLCSMAFTDTGVNTALWVARPGENGWLPQIGELAADAAPNETLTTIASVPINGTIETTFDMLAHLDTKTIRDDTGGFTFWLRASPNGRSLEEDLGCEVTFEGVQSGLFLRGPDATGKIFFPLPEAAAFRLRASILEGIPITTFKCAIDFKDGNGNSVGGGDVMGGGTAFDDGRVAFSARSWKVEIQGLVISDRE